MTSLRRRHVFRAERGKLNSPVSPSNLPKAPFRRFFGDKLRRLQLTDSWAQKAFDLSRIAVGARDANLLECQFTEISRVV